MRLQQLRIKRFKHLSGIDFDCSVGHMTSICGKNGTGKSSIAESLFFLLTGRGFFQGSLRTWDTMDSPSVACIIDDELWVREKAAGWATSKDHQQQTLCSPDLLKLIFILKSEFLDRPITACKRALNRFLALGILEQAAKHSQNLAESMKLEIQAIKTAERALLGASNREELECDISDLVGKLQVVEEKQQRLQQQLSHDHDILLSVEHFKALPNECPTCKQLIKTEWRGGMIKRLQSQLNPDYQTFRAMLASIQETHKSLTAQVYQAKAKMATVQAVEPIGDRPDRMELYKTWQRLFKRDVPSYLIAGFIGSLNDCLAVMNDRLPTDLRVNFEYKDGDLTVHASVRGSKANYNSLSTGEKRICDLLVGLALQDVGLSWASSNVVFVDEVLDPLHIDVAQAILELLYDRYETVVLLTHNNQLASFAHTMYTIEDGKLLQ